MIGAREPPSSFSGSTQRQAQRQGRPLPASAIDPAGSGRPLTMQQTTERGMHDLTALVPTLARIPRFQAHRVEETDPAHTRAVDGYWGGTLDPVARLRAAAQLTDLTTMKEVLFAKERFGERHSRPEELEAAAAELEAAIEKVQESYRKERSARRQGHSDGSPLVSRGGQEGLADHSLVSMSLESGRRRSSLRAAGDPGESDPAAEEIAMRRRERASRRAKCSSHVGTSASAAEAEALGHRVGLDRGFAEGGREMSAITALDSGKRDSAGRQPEPEPEPEPESGASAEAAEVSGIRALVLSPSPSGALFPRGGLDFSAADDSQPGDDGLVDWGAALTPGQSRVSAAPSTLTRPSSARSRTVRARRRARAVGSVREPCCHACPACLLANVRTLIVAYRLVFRPVPWALSLYGFQGPRKVNSDAIVEKWSGLLEPGKTTLSPREGRLVERVAAPDQPQTVWPKDRLSPQTLAPQLDQRHEHLQLDVHEKLDQLDHEMMQLEKHYVGATEVMSIRMSPPPPIRRGITMR